MLYTYFMDGLEESYSNLNGLIEVKFLSTSIVCISKRYYNVFYGLNGFFMKT